MGEYVSLELAGKVATIMLARPPMNALSRQMQEELRAAAVEVSARREIYHPR